MFKQLDLKVIGGIVIIAVLLLAGTHFYSKWSYERFASEIGASPESTTPSKDTSESDKTESVEQSKATQTPKSGNENVKVKPKPMVKSELANTAKENEASAEKRETPQFDASSLMSTFGIPEEVKSLLDEDAEEADFEKAQAYLAEKYGQSPKVDAIMDRLKQMSGGPVELEDLTALFEDWIEILPEEQQENRRQLMGVLTLLNQAKAQGGSSPVQVIVGTDLDLDPSLLEGENVQRFKIETTETEIIND
ncbi:hypothetical protein C6500_01110 [Candidatus Poribacteria bacterium]|nr:MAG: hypothetical protein C6500_01110 [Candidatus Poribacteria bacterium]